MSWATAHAAEQVVVALGGASDAGSAAAAVKLDLLSPIADVTLVAVRPWLDDGDTVHLVAYAWDGASLQLMWDSGPVDVVPGWVEGPPADLVLAGGGLYAVGYWIPPGEPAAYPYNEPGTLLFPWGSSYGAAYTSDGDDPILPDPLAPLFGDHQYQMELDLWTPVDADGDGVFEDQDCDDSDGDVYPGAPERCDGEDDDCDDVVDEEVVEAPWYVDADGDGFGAGVPTWTCAESGPPGTVDDGTDCNDEDDAVSPAAIEACNATDDDCDDLVDDGLPMSPAWPDGDGDGDGDADAAPFPSCDPNRPGEAPTGGDCNDEDPAVASTAWEACNALDDDCDGLVDDGTPTLVYWPDADADGWGDPAGPSITTCEGPPAGHVVAEPDCDDADPTRHPGQPEVCNARDDDCDDVVPDDEVVDFDADGVEDCADCRPKDPTIHPGAVELCDGIDRDCNGTRSQPGDCGAAPGTTPTVPENDDPPVDDALFEKRTGCTQSPRATPWGLLALTLLRRRARATS